MACISVDRHQIYGSYSIQTKGAFYVYSIFLILDSFAFLTKSAPGFLDNESKSATILRNFCRYLIVDITFIKKTGVSINTDVRNSI